MKLEFPIELSGVERVVINRTHVWVRTVDNNYFTKTSGGPGFKKFKVMKTSAMVRMINEKVRTYIWRSIPYSFWFNNGTINIALKESPS